MKETDLYLKGLSLKSCLEEVSFSEASLKTEADFSLKTTRVIPLDESLEDALKIIKREEVYRDEEHGFIVYRKYNKLCPEGIELAYNIDGKLIGSPKEAEFICITKGIKPTTFDDRKVCSIGFNEEEQAWYGWSHRAFSPPFTVGYIVDNPDHICLGCFGPNEKSIKLGFEAKSLDDCKTLAIAYAYSVE